MCDLRGYFAPGDSVAHFTPERGLLLSSQQQGTFDLHPIVREYAYDRLVDKKAIHIRLRDCFTSVPVAKQPRNLRDLTPVIEVYHHTIGAGRYDEAWEVYNSRLRTSLYYELGEFELDFEREEKRIGEPHFLFTPLGTKSTLRNITKNFDPSACCGVNTRKPEK